MNLRAVLVLAASVALSAAAPASVAAQQSSVRVTFADGRVSVIAQNATLLEILNEWSRVGGSTFMKAEQIPAPERLTLQLENVTEIRALEVLLRPAAGYAAAPRRTAGLSTIGAVLIKPTSTGPVMAQGPSMPPMVPEVPSNTNNRFTPMTRPDDDGPTQRQQPPPMPSPSAMTNTPAGTQQNPGAPMGQSSPLQGTTTQTVPGMGTTSSQPGAIIPNTRPGGKPAPLTPTQPPTRPGGGG